MLPEESLVIVPGERGNTFSSRVKTGEREIFCLFRITVEFEIASPSSVWTGLKMIEVPDIRLENGTFERFGKEEDSEKSRIKGDLIRHSEPSISNPLGQYPRQIP
jgi:hypothetical protein